MKRNIAAGLLSVALAATAQANSIQIGQSGLNTEIPEDGSGLVSQITVNAPGVVQDVNVWLNIGAVPDDRAWNGDLYVSLTHVDPSRAGMSVLLNRVGRGQGGLYDGDGFGPNGFRITLDDQAGFDVHWYGAHAPVFNENGQLTGDWQPDGRLLDPAAAPELFASDLRGGLLASFNGMDAAGDWNLYLYDASGGFVSQLNGWGMDIEVQPVPESSQGGCLFYIVLFSGLFLAAARQQNMAREH